MKKQNEGDIKIFAIIWSFIFVVIALYPLLSKGTIQYWSLLVAFIFALIALIKPMFLLPFYSLWIRVGEVIGGVVSKIIMFILFYALFTPIAIVLKLLKIDLLNKKIDKDRSTYWIKRENQPGSLKNQF